MHSSGHYQVVVLNLEKKMTFRTIEFFRQKPLEINLMSVGQYYGAIIGVERGRARFNPINTFGNQILLRPYHLFGGLETTSHQSPARLIILNIRGCYLFKVETRSKKGAPFFFIF